ncbi:MAG: hypothetical protein U0521_29100 [Anaerolineae bacterium]
MKSALIVWGGWEGHQPKLTAELFAGILEGEGYTVEVSEYARCAARRDENAGD